jgi:hypothetical protein
VETVPNLLRRRRAARACRDPNGPVVVSDRIGSGEAQERGLVGETLSQSSTSTSNASVRSTSTLVRSVVR